jgi:uroporphyrinogen-III decarboxylase
VDNDWLLLTFDDDFLSLVEGQGLDHRGLVYVRQAGRQIGDVVKLVDEHLQNRPEDDQSIQYL